jgi:probable HAF family extracellular repeat protein
MHSIITLMFNGFRNLTCLPLVKGIRGRCSGTAARIALLLAVLMAFNGAVRAQTHVALYYPGAFSTTAYGINSSGKIVGSNTDSSGTVHGFLYSAGVFSKIDYSGAIETAATGITDKKNTVRQAASRGL